MYPFVCSECFFLLLLLKRRNRKNCLFFLVGLDWSPFNHCCWKLIISIAELQQMGPSNNTQYLLYYKSSVFITGRTISHQNLFWLRNLKWPVYLQTCILVEKKLCLQIGGGGWGGCGFSKNIIWFSRATRIALKRTFVYTLGWFLLLKGLCAKFR